MAADTITALTVYGLAAGLLAATIYYLKANK